jgi:hypothetical protein
MYLAGYVSGWHGGVEQIWGLGYRVQCYIIIITTPLSPSWCRKENRELGNKGTKEERTRAVVAPLFRVEWSGTQIEYPAIPSRYSKLG